MVTCGHQFHTGDESDWLISSSAACPMDGNTTAAKILRKLIRKHCKKFPNEMDEIRIETDKEILSFKKLNHHHEEENIENKKTATDFSFYSQPDNNHYAISQFLQEHYRNYDEDSGEENDSPTDSCLQSKPIQLSTSKERETKLKNHRENRIKYNSNISAFYDFGDFDETQHLDGCPVKWLYRKKSVESLETLKNSKWFVKKQQQEREGEKKIKTGKAKNFRDRTPVEMKIRKMKLKKRDSYEEPDSPDSIKAVKKIPKLRRNLSTDANVEVHKKNLAAKLNWKPFAENRDDGGSEVSEKSARDGYLPPRPLLGLRPLLSILLSPRIETPCCSVSKHLAQNTRHDDRRSQSASLSITSLDLPSLADAKKTRPKTTRSPRWGSKAIKSQQKKKLQTPNQITIKLRHHVPRKSSSSKPATNEDSKSNDSGSSTTNNNKKPNSDKIKPLKHSHSLNSLCYELGNKIENRKMDYFEQMIRELATEDKDFKIKRFLNSNNLNKIQCDKNNPTNNGKNKEKKINKNFQDNNQDLKNTEDEQFQIICSKVQFFERPGKPMK